MRNYEIVLVIHPDSDETALNGIVEKVKAWITDSGGEVEKVELWGKRRMAYEIKKQRDAHYILFNVKMAPTFGAELERNLRFTETILRSLISMVEK
jgi:small subunit ribosomal protein S6